MTTMNRIAILMLLCMILLSLINHTTEVTNVITLIEKTDNSYNFSTYQGTSEFYEDECKLVLDETVYYCYKNFESENTEVYYFIKNTYTGVINEFTLSHSQESDIWLLH